MSIISYHNMKKKMLRAMGLIYKSAEDWVGIRAQGAHRIQEIGEDKLIGFPYDDGFKTAVLNKYPNAIIEKMLEIGDLRLGLLLKRLEKDRGLYDEWLIEYAKSYSPLGYYEDFDDPNEAKYGELFDKLAEKLKEKS